MKVSVVIACYNQGEWVGEAIESILNQTVKCEIIVVDDGSMDCTYEEAMSYDIDKYIWQPNNGVSSARNIGIAASSGEAIICLDADDMFEPNAVELMLGVYDDCIVRPAIHLIGDVDVALPYKVQAPKLHQFLDKDNMAVCSCMFPKHRWREIGGYDEEMKDGYEDWDFWVRMLNNHDDMKSIVKPVFLYRRHGLTMHFHSKNKHNEIVAYMREKWKRLGII